MPNYALVIGIDDYTDEITPLSAAVDDALRFAQWLLGPGGVDVGNLQLLLSPTKTVEAPKPPIVANCENIKAALEKYQDSAGRGGDCFYFYYAGHGLSAPGMVREPAILPCDVRKLRRHNHRLLSFSDIMPLLGDVEPAKQFFFIDACRDLALEDGQPAIGRLAGIWRPQPDLARPQSAQYILYATAPGHQSFEKVKGRGVFTKALLEGLRGNPTALRWSSSKKRYEARFSRLVSHVRLCIERDIQESGARDWQRYVQIPEPHMLGGSGEPDPVLATFEPEQVGTLTVRVRVRPSEARRTCQVRVQHYLPGGKRAVDAADPEGPPVPLPAKFELSPGDYSFEARAQSYQLARESKEVYRPQAIKLVLQPRDDIEPEPSPKSAQPGQDGALVVWVHDPNVATLAWDGEGRLVGTEKGGLLLKPLAPGLYRVQLMLPEGPGPEQMVEVLPGPITHLTLAAPGPEMGQDQMDMLEALDIRSGAGGYLHPSEFLGGIANAKLSSLLSFAAFAGHWPGDGFYRLRRFGIQPVTDIPPGESGLLVLLGVSGDRPTPHLTPAEFLSTGRLVARGAGGQTLFEGGLETLSGFHAAAQRAVILKPGPVDLRIVLPGSAPTHYALMGLPDRITVLVVVAEDRGGFDIQQYLFPVSGRQASFQDYLAQDPYHVRYVELAQRYYANGRPIPESQDLDKLLAGEWLDPLLGCLAGYSLYRDGRLDRYRGQPDRAGRFNRPAPSAMHNMLTYFGTLPDSHVLAGLCQPEQQAEHYARAHELGVPIFTEGFRALFEWRKEQDVGAPEPPPGTSRRLLSSSPWTAWVSKEMHEALTPSATPPGTDSGQMEAEADRIIDPVFGKYSEQAEDAGMLGLGAAMTDEGKKGGSPMSTETAEGRQYVEKISRAIVTEIAPEELDLFDELLAEYYEDPEPPDPSASQSDDPLGFGLPELMMALTPFVAAVVSAVLKYLFVEVGKEAIDAILKRRRGDVEEGGPELLTREQLSMVKEIARRQCKEWGVEADQCAKMSAALIGELALVTPGTGT